MPKSQTEKAKIESKRQQLAQMITAFCAEYLDDDYKSLCIKMIDKMSRKRTVPFLSGKIEIWAAAIVYAIGSINFLFDRNFEPYATAEDICDFFNTNKSTTAQKAALIRNMFKMGYWDKEFATGHSKRHDPFRDLVEINGFIIPNNMLPQEIRRQIEEDHED
ncbi:MAG: hypothetical protein H8E87_07705 [FCB group bacterium]|nr:hypothetical protein [FCB group bacterium]